LPYCRRCGTQLDENARFCYRCGTPVDPSTPPVQPAPVYQPYTYQQAPPPQAEAKPHRPMYKDPIVVGTVALIVILLSAVVIGVFMIAPIKAWNSNGSLSDENQAANVLNLNFHTNVGQVNVMTLKLGESRNILITMQANGTYGFMGGPTDPVTFTFDNQTIGDVLTVKSEVMVDESATERSNVAVQIFVDPALNLNLNVSSSTGKVSFVADKPTTIQCLNLDSSTGEVEANLQANVTLTGDITLKSSTSDVNFRLSQDAIMGNRTITLQSSTGSVVADLTQTRTFSGHLQVNAETSTGSVHVGLIIDNAVAAKITSQTGTFGDVKTNLNNFQGNDSSVQSLNYPSTCNIDVSGNVSTGDIYIDANYRTTLIYS
jgi:hypothetical protein